ncbi:COP9 signalosome complex subunit 6 [Echinococcus multilocularis]|uniref:COP9 signalosome complex subunit 6 n=1 Tax=Echinococcus multilocularis TaxID=6211 RepID=A0A068Y0F5_ECHMU|nr:COP9 signalosome complex subunit 6 [Echinococcus multilocularis]
MDTDLPNDPVDTNSNQDNISVSIHPLVVLNVSEHWMREKLALDSTAVVVYGALLGKHRGREIEYQIFNSYEILVNEDMTVDRDYFAAREGQFKQVYPGLDLIGWYATGGPITEENKLLNSRFLEGGESLIILKLNPLEKSGERLPIRVYETVVGSDSCVDFKQIPYTLAHDAIEHIGVDHLARVNASASGATGSGGGVGSSADDISPTAECLMGNFHAVQMLSKRLHLLRDYVDAVMHGELPSHAGRLREIRALLSRLPHCPESEGTDPDTVGADGGSSMHGGDDGTNSLLRQANDVCLSSLLGGLTRALQSLHSWICQERLVAACKDASAKGQGIGTTTTSQRLRPTFKMPLPPPTMEVVAAGEDGTKG